ncbi:MAG: alanine--tRNA ligase [Crocinitomicaceae bacterium]|nr:alanine--tRNA ligase [Crocinitomicaceae bacterium]
MTSREIRNTFLHFFAERGHQIVPSAPMVIKGDPTLMFTNAGMNQFKELFLGNAEIKYPRIVDTQKCLRVSGKHNDLEEVGVDTYHHTMFEMLGNWSFGDYFKKDAINWAWELLTEVYKIPKDRLYVTVFEGDEKEKLDFDQESYDLWKALISEERILKGNKKDNFWEMGDSGPCGPCTEIHVDVRPDSERQKKEGRLLVNQGDPQVIEIWNNVFMQFNRKADRTLEILPAQHVDTGMGFERLCMVLQGKLSNYDTDVFSPLIEAIEKISLKKYERGGSKKDIAMRVIADHVRAVSFAIADGQLPSSGGAGYVIRRILRRAIRYGYSFLDRREAFIFQLVKVLVAEMGDYFPELRNSQDIIIRVIREEEESFLRTLEKGIHLLDSIITRTPHDVLDGKTVFELYDTFGFPVDLTALIAAENNKRIDIEGFNSWLQKQKERSRAATRLETDDWVVLSEGETRFVGYDQIECDTKILRYRKVKSRGKESFQLVLDVTPFYAEGGGQVGDQGFLSSANERIVVSDTKKENNLIIHFVDQLPENPEAIFVAQVDSLRRMETMSNHSATHLLHQALREVLGSHVEQKGSLVGPDYLRFDFSHFAKVPDTDIGKVEALVNERIRGNYSLEENRSATMEEAINAGAMMLFGEKYGNIVRMIRFGSSIELCGGTHVKSTGSIGFFKIIAESAVASGIRRIEAISAGTAYRFVREQSAELAAIQEALKSRDILKSIRELQVKNNELQKQLDVFHKEKTLVVKKELLNKFKVINGVSFLAEYVPLGAADIKDIAFQIRGEMSTFLAVFGSEEGGKVTITCVLSDDLVSERKLNASAIIRDLSKDINGGGGGQPFFATAGGTNAAGLAKALARAEIFLS